jgi:hypothetical protein
MNSLLPRQRLWTFSKRVRRGHDILWAGSRKRGGGYLDGEVRVPLVSVWLESNGQRAERLQQGREELRHGRLPARQGRRARTLV